MTKKQLNQSCGTLGGAQTEEAKMSKSTFEEKLRIKSKKDDQLLESILKKWADTNFIPGRSKSFAEKVDEIYESLVQSYNFGRQLDVGFSTLECIQLAMQKSSSCSRIWNKIQDGSAEEIVALKHSKSASFLAISRFLDYVMRDLSIKVSKQERLPEGWGLIINPAE